MTVEDVIIHAFRNGSNELTREQELTLITAQTTEIEMYFGNTEPKRPRIVLEHRTATNPNGLHALTGGRRTALCGRLSLAI